MRQSTSYIINYFILLMLLVGAHGEAKSQPQTPQPWKVGIRAQPLISYLINDSDNDIVNGTSERKPFVGYVAGLGLGQGFSKAFGFETGLYFAKVGGAQLLTLRDSMLRDSSVELRTQVNYFQVPLSFRLFSNQAQRLRFESQLGLVLSFRNQVRAYANETRQNDFVGGDNRRQSDFFALAELSAMGSAGISYAINEQWEADAAIRATHSILNVEDPVFQAPGRGPTRLVTVGIWLGLSYKIPFRALSGSSN